MARQLGVVESPTTNPEHARPAEARARMFPSRVSTAGHVGALPQVSDTTIPTKLKVVTKATGEGLFPLRDLRTGFVNYLSHAGDTPFRLSRLNEVIPGADFLFEPFAPCSRTNAPRT
jgi:hypothetical protein